MSGVILQLVGPSTGGIRRHVQALTEDLRGAGWDVVVAAPVGVIDEARRIDVPGGLSPSALRRARMALAELVEEGRPDVIHAHGLKAGWVAVGVDRRRTVLTVHNVVIEKGIRAALLRRLERRVVRRSASVIATSNEIADRLRSAHAGIVVIEPVHEVIAADVSVAALRQELGVKGPLVVSVGRLHAQKALNVLVDAMTRIARVRPEISAVVAGDGPERRTLQASIDAASIGSNLELLGARQDATSLMAAADVVVVTSSWESGPLTVLEAGAVAAPLVSTPVGFVPEIVEDGVSGLLVPIGDTEALVGAILSLVDDPDRAKRMGERLRDAVLPRLDRTGPTRAVVATYEDVMAGVGGGRA